MENSSESLLGKKAQQRSKKMNKQNRSLWANRQKVIFFSMFLCYDIILLEFHSVCFNWNLTFYFDTSIWFSTISLSESESPVSKALYTRYMLDLWLNITYIKNLKKMHMLWNWKSVCEKLANDFGSDRCNCQMFEFKVTAYNKFITTRVCTGPVGRHRVYKL